MKHLLLFIAIISFSFVASAVDPLVGYVVMANNDTLKCEIKAGKFLNNLSGDYYYK